MHLTKVMLVRSSSTLGNRRVTVSNRSNWSSLNVVAVLKFKLFDVTVTYYSREGVVELYYGKKKTLYGIYAKFMPGDKNDRLRQRRANHWRSPAC